MLLSMRMQPNVSCFFVCLFIKKSFIVNYALLLIFFSLDILCFFLLLLLILTMFSTLKKKETNDKEFNNV